MARYTIHVPAKAVTRAAALERAVFVRDGWSWGAFAFGPFWLFWHRHFIVGAIIFCAFGFATSVLQALPMLDEARIGILALLQLLLGLEGASLRRLALGWAGYAEEALAVGEDRETLERRYFEAEIAARPAEAPLAGLPARSASGLPVLGLFPEARTHR